MRAVDPTYRTVAPILVNELQLRVLQTQSESWSPNTGTGVGAGGPPSSSAADRDISRSRRRSIIWNWFGVDSWKSRDTGISLAKMPADAVAVGLFAMNP